MFSSSRMMFGPMDDVHELAFIERPIRRSLKTAEEIDQLTVDEDLNDIERAVYLLSVGQEVQRASVISNLPILVRQNPAETFRRVVPKVREVLSGAGSDVQVAAATSFLTILQDDIILIHTHTFSILKTVLLHLHHPDTVVSSAWLETLLCSISALPKETIKQEVLNPLLYQSQLSHSLQARLASCRILGKVACKFDSHIVKTELLPLARSLCQDQDLEVRACMCRQLESIARAGGVDTTRTELLGDLVELAGDDETSVRLAAFDTVINLLEMMDGDDRLHVVVPMVMAACEVSLQEDEAVVVSLSFQFGKLCTGLAGCLSEEQRTRLLQRFKALCVAGLQTERNQTDGKEATLIRCNCCYNLPAMVMFADSAHFLSEVYPSFSSLCCDPEVSVRRSAAAGFHQNGGVLLQKVLPVQKEAARTFCTFLRYNRKQEQRQEMMEQLIQGLAQGRSYWNRLRFLDVCETAIEIFSRKYFNKHFLVPALDLVQDPVANVRYKLCQMLPRLRSLLRLPTDKQLLQKLDVCVQKLLWREKDKDVVAAIRKTVLELDKLDITEPFHKRQERDLLDQKKEKEETLLLEMEQLERQQSDGKLSSEKHPERRRRDSKTSLSATKSMSVSSAGPTLSSGREMRKAKLSRSRSLSSQPTTSKAANSDRPLKVKELSSMSGPGKSSVLSGKDDSLRTAHFSLVTQSSSSMPVLIRSNTTSLLDRAGTLDHRTSTLDQRDHRTSNMDHRNNLMEQRTGNMDQRTSTIDQRDHRPSSLDQRDHRPSTLDQRDHSLSVLDQRDPRTSTLDHRDHRTSTLDQRDHRPSSLDQRDHRPSTLDRRSKTMERGCMVKDGQSRKMLVNRKSNSFSVQSGRD
ncbi:serine/threonine-protein phosphatase 4 regulatory subunit 4 [Etheostoma cragini]|uniref:serine/threonine-protein phosphatase 4 regulatory subunit 4 n=1 Tax=Etheostoma cragini TaxID=417921 RepID=UPI00155E687E|nr:serine/threonine-protein phosphatase 4 regulatory subunit 4 [Etheostoma cragini]